MEGQETSINEFSSSQLRRAARPVVLSLLGLGACVQDMENSREPADIPQIVDIVVGSISTASTTAKPEEAASVLDLVGAPSDWAVARVSTPTSSTSSSLVATYCADKEMPQNAGHGNYNNSGVALSFDATGVPCEDGLAGIESRQIITAEFAPYQAHAPYISLDEEERLEGMATRCADPSVSPTASLSACPPEARTDGFTDLHTGELEAESLQSKLKVALESGVEVIQVEAVGAQSENDGGYNLNGDAVIGADITGELAANKARLEECLIQYPTPEDFPGGFNFVDGVSPEGMNMNGQTYPDMASLMEAYISERGGQAEDPNVSAMEAQDKCVYRAAEDVAMANVMKKLVPLAEEAGAVVIMHGERGRLPGGYRTLTGAYRYAGANNEALGTLGFVGEDSFGEDVVAQDPLNITFLATNQPELMPERPASVTAAWGMIQKARGEGVPYEEDEDPSYTFMASKDGGAVASSVVVEQNGVQVSCTLAGADVAEGFVTPEEPEVLVARNAEDPEQTPHLVEGSPYEEACGGAVGSILASARKAVEAGDALNAEVQ